MALLDPKIGEPQKPIPPLPEIVGGTSATWAMVVAVLRFGKLPDEGTRKKLDKLGEKFRAELGALKGFSYDDARREFKTAVHAALDGKGDPNAVRTSESLIRRNSIVRQAVKQRASKVSREACLIAADVLKAGLKIFPEYERAILEQESALVPAEVTNQLGGSPLRALLKQMPKFIEAHIAKLRDNPMPMVDPSNLLK